MFKLNRILLIATYIFMIYFQYPAIAGENFSPVKNNSKKWRIGYFQGREYYEFSKQLRGLVEGLMKLKWIDTCDIPEEENANELWRWLSKNVKSDYIEFVEQYFWENVNIYADIKGETRKKIEKRFFLRKMILI